MSKLSSFLMVVLALIVGGFVGSFIPNSFADGMRMRMMERHGERGDYEMRGEG